MDAARRSNLAAIELALLLAAAIMLRFINLGYSNLQGDEIKAFCYSSNFAFPTNFLGFLLMLLHGSVEFIVVCTVGLMDPSSSSELQPRLRVPFANLLGIACLFGLAWFLFNRQTAI